MKVVSITEIVAGDKIMINGSIRGVVAFSTISDSFSAEYPKKKNSGFENDGILIIQSNGARIFHDTEFLNSDDCTIEVMVED